MRPTVIAIASCVVAVVAIACAKAPEARMNANMESSTDGGVSSALAEREVSDAGAVADARVPGLPMPQKFPPLVWDAAGVPPRDAAAR
jgi:hypothetical protein